MMKKIILFYAVFIWFFSCQRKQCDTETQYVDKVELEHGIFDEYYLDSLKVLYPEGIFSFQDYLILIEPKNNPVLSFWTLDSLKYLFSDIHKGGGPNDIIRPRANYFSSSDSSFYLLDSGIEREFMIKEHSVSIKSNTPLMLFDAVNQLVHIDENHYIMGGYTSGEGNEHLIYKDGVRSGFGEYPVSDNLKGTEKFFFNHKFTAGMRGKEVILDFYLYRNLIRIYGIDGSLKKEISLGGIPDRHNTVEDMTYPYRTGRVIPTDDYVYSLYSEGNRKDKQQELQVWSWEGKLVRRIKFNKYFFRFTVANNGKLYALSPSDSDNPYVVYVYDLSKKKFKKNILKRQTNGELNDE